MSDLYQLVGQIKQQKPLILNLSNYVTMDFVANGLLSMGASPVMTMAEAELADLVRLSNAVVINIGTLHDEFIRISHKACALANQLQKPLILDPVGAGASSYRTHNAKELIANHQFAIIRANASEIAALAGLAAVTKGVDATIDAEAIVAVAEDYACQQDVVISISGVTDYIIADNKLALNHSGSLLMPMITGTGCLLTAVTAAFHAIETDAFSAAVAAITVYGQCGERAAGKAKAPASFRDAFLDELYLFGENAHG